MRSPERPWFSTRSPPRGTHSGQERAFPVTGLRPHLRGMRRWRARWRGCSPTSCTCAGASRYGDGPFRAFTWSARAPDAAVDAHGVDAVRDLVRTRGTRAPRPETRGGSRTWSARGMRGEKPPHRPPGCPPGRGIPGGPRKNGQENIFPFAGVWCRIMSIRYPMESAPCRNGSLPCSPC